MPARYSSGGYIIYKIEQRSFRSGIFELNTKAYPTSSNTFDSLGEAFLQKGDKESAKKNYRRALEIDPTNIHAKNMLDKIR